MTGTVINITRFCTDDGPGIRTTVFLKGCPLRCLWCHNPESQRGERERYTDGEEIGREMTAEEVLQEVLRDKVFYGTSGGGVTVSGGEPLMQSEFTAEIFRLCREHGIHTAMETSGFGSKQALDRVLPHCDLVLFDIKETDSDRHLRYTGVKPEPIWENLKRIQESGTPFLVRLPIIPGLNDRAEHFAAVKALCETMSHCRGTQIMPYHKLGNYKYEKLGRPYECAQIEEPTKAQVEAWKTLL